MRGLIPSAQKYVDVESQLRTQMLAYIAPALSIVLNVEKPMTVCESNLAACDVSLTEVTSSCVCHPDE